MEKSIETCKEDNCLKDGTGAMNGCADVKNDTEVVNGCAGVKDITEASSECVGLEMGLDAYIRQRFQLPDVDVRTYSPLTLAFIGDGIYDLIIRSIIVGEGNTRASQLHQHTSHLVKAHSQSAMLEYMFPHMTEEENAVYRRGRNAKSPTMAKNATMSDYRRATGFEALMGYLYLTDQFERLVDLVQIGLTGLKEEELCATKN